MSVNTAPSFAVGAGMVSTTAVGERTGPLVLQSDGKVVFSATHQDELMLARYDANGVLDPTFGGDGVISTGASASRGMQVSVQDDGRVVALAAHVGGTDLL